MHTPHSTDTYTQRLNLRFVCVLLLLLLTRSLPAQSANRHNSFLAAFSQHCFLLQLASFRCFTALVPCKCFTVHSSRSTVISTGPVACSLASRTRPVPPDYLFAASLFSSPALPLPAMSAASPTSPQQSAPPSVTLPQQTDPNSTQLYINNLSFTTTPESLVAFFASSLSAPPADVNIITHKYSGRSKGFGFVRVSNADAPAALALNGRELDGRELGIAEAVEKTEEERAAQRARRDARRQAVQAKRKEDAGQGASGGAAGGGRGPAAMDQSGGAGLTSSDRSLPRPRPPRVVRVVPDNHTQLYVSNLSYSLTTEQLKELVEEAIGAEGAEVDIIKRKGGLSDGRSRGYGFVTVPNDKLDQALTLNGREVDSRAISVVIAKERPVTEPDAAGTAGGDAELSQAAAPRRKRPNRRRGPARVNGDGAPETAEAASAGTGNMYADGSSAPTPAGQDAGGQQRRRQPRSNRKPRGGAQGVQSAGGSGSEVAATQQ